jgi:hypothetical protein
LRTSPALTERIVEFSTRTAKVRQAGIGRTASRLRTPEVGDLSEALSRSLGGIGRKPARKAGASGAKKGSAKKK